MLLRHPKPQLSPHWGEQLPGALHQYVAGRGAASSASGMTPKNRGVRLPFHHHVLVTGHFATQPGSSGRDLFSPQMAASWWDEQITGGQGRIQLKCASGFRLDGAARAAQPRGWKRRAKGTSFPIWLKMSPKPCYWQPGVSRTWKC